MDNFIQITVFCPPDLRVATSSLGLFPFEGKALGTRLPRVGGAFVYRNARKVYSIKVALAVIGSCKLGV